MPKAGFIGKKCVYNCTEINKTRYWFRTRLYMHSNFANFLFLGITYTFTVCVTYCESTHAKCVTQKFINT